MTISENAARVLVGTLPHPAPVRASCERSVSDFGTYSGNTSPPLLCSFALNRGMFCTKLYRHAGEHRDTRNDRRMIAVTVALSEPWDSPELDWPETIAANLRLLYANTTVEVIDTWRTDQ